MRKKRQRKKNKGCQRVGRIRLYFQEKRDYKHAFYMGISAGSASAFSENLVAKEEIEAV